jgi:tetratricopeptide (TPR) repeat protein
MPLLMKLKRYSEPLEAYKKALELDPNVTLNYDDFKQVLLALGRKEEAELIHAKAVLPTIGCHVSHR